jgi:hypothetical protein
VSSDLSPRGKAITKPSAQYLGLPSLGTPVELLRRHTSPATKIKISLVLLTFLFPHLVTISLFPSNLGGCSAAWKEQLTRHLLLFSKGRLRLKAHGRVGSGRKERAKRRGNCVKDQQALIEQPRLSRYRLCHLSLFSRFYFVLFAVNPLSPVPSTYRFSQPHDGMAPLKGASLRVSRLAHRASRPPEAPKVRVTFTSGHKRP